MDRKTETPLPPGPPRESPPSMHDRVRNRLLRLGALGALGTGAIWMAAHNKPKAEAHGPEKPPDSGCGEPLHGKSADEIEAQFFVPHEDGEYTEEERHARTKFLPHGEKIFEDNGLLFYRVEKGDTRDKIREKLAAYPEFAYLETQTEKTQSLNIPEKHVQRVTWIPIPHENADRHISDEQFVLHIKQAVQELKKHERYGQFIKDILAQDGMTEEKLFASMLAIAKQESGGAPIGSHEVFRWEGGGSHHEYSFSYFHVLQMGPGLKARKALNMTEGQTYHPKNAAKLFLAFLCEKDKEVKKIDVTECFPFTQSSLNTFSTFYNGSGWRENNASYPGNVLRFYNAALEKMDDLLDTNDLELKIYGTPALPLGTYQYEKVADDEETDFVFLNIESGETLWHAIGRADGSNQKAQLSQDACKEAEQHVYNYFKQKYGHQKYFPEDRIGVMQAGGQIFVVYQRGSTRAKILVKHGE